MSKIGTGGPAFPIFETRFPDGVLNSEAVDGMTLRDYFAAKAMQGLLSDLPKSLYGLDWEARMVASAFSVADAMLEARK
jgi:hypothetical protein